MVYTQYIDESLGPVSIIGCSLHLIMSNFYPGPVTYYVSPGLVHGEEEPGYEAMWPLASCMCRRSLGRRLCGPWPRAWGGGAWV